MRASGERKFEYAVDSWRRIFASIEAPQDRWQFFGEAAEDLAQFVARGMSKGAVAEALQGLVHTHLATMNVDDVQTVMADAFSRVDAEAEHVPDDIDWEPKSNGHGQQARPSRFQLKPFDAITLSTAPNYLVKGVLPRVGLAVIWGPPKCGKSFWSYDIAMHIALGRKYRGHQVQPGPVVYLALEGGSGFCARVEAWRQRHLGDHHGNVPFYLLDVPVDLVADHKQLIAAVGTQLGSQTPVAVFVDTLNRALIGDENKSDDMAKFIRAADTIRTTFGCLVVVIHHCGIQGGRPRGHTSLSGADDVQLAVDRDKDGNIVVTVEHMKDAEAGPPIASRLERVDLGVDDDGDPITSCVIVPTALPTPGPKLSGANKLALDSLQEVLSEVGEVPAASNHIPPGRPVCSVVLWREHFYRVYAGKPDTKQKAFVRATLKLQELHLIGIWSDKAWVAGHTGHSPTNGQMSG